MQTNNNATCSICGRSYRMCMTCNNSSNLKPWKRHTDTSEHYKIYQVIHGYSTGVYNKEEASNKLQMIDLSDFNDLRDNIKNIINDITGKAMVDDTVEVSAVNLLNETCGNNENINGEIVSEQTKVTRRKRSLKVVETE